MDFEDSREEAEYRARARAFLQASAKRKPVDSSRGYRDGNESHDALAKARIWQQKKAAAGFAAITWPKQWGGPGGTAIQQVIYNQEEAEFDVPVGFFELGIGWAMPSLFAWGAPAQVLPHAERTRTGAEIWCQLFSEPAGGTDLAALRTRAERQGDEWVINGQKIWTTGAQFSDYGLLITRSDFTVPKHKGLTAFYVDMKSPGVEVRPIRQMSGEAHFNEVFFNDVRIPDSQRLGAPGDGFKVVLTTLNNERFNISELFPPDFDQLFELVRNLEYPEGPAIQNAAIRERLADFYIKSQGVKCTNFRAMTALSRGETPGPEISIGKLVSSARLQDLSAFGVDLMDAAGIMTDPDQMPMKALFQRGYLYSPGLRVGGGTDEIIRNVIAERVLGLPAEVRVDKDIPFNRLPTGKR